MRSCVLYDPAKASIAAKILTDAALMAIALPWLYEFVCVLGRGLSIENAYTISAIRALMACKNLEMNQPATEAGLAMLNAGGDFTDGVNAMEGN